MSIVPAARRPGLEARVTAEHGRLGLLLQIVVVELVGLGVVDAPPPESAAQDWLDGLAGAAGAALGAGLGAAVARWCADAVSLLGAAHPAHRDPTAHRLGELSEAWRHGTLLMDDLWRLRRPAPRPPVRRASAGRVG